MRYFVIYKPYGYLSQFTPEGRWQGLGDLFDFPKDAYAVGRLDADSEGLLILTNDKSLNHRLLHPSQQHLRTYAAQVEGVATEEHVQLLEKGVSFTAKDKTHFASARTRLLEEVNFPERSVPIRFRKNVPTSWIELTVDEGKNRQIRKMTAASGLPTLRLIRTAIEQLTLGTMQPGEVSETTAKELFPLLKL